jgi:nicotinate-nucleotide pyrophosphorylase (carboxylating)
VYGKAKGILKSERVALNFISLISGVATFTKKFVNKVKGKSCKICCTRKTLPNLRLIQKYGVKLGGGLNHRFNLSDEILIKDNHIAIDGNIRKLVKRAIKNKKRKKITVEIDNLNQFKKINDLKFDRILFDNMSLKNLKKGVKMSKRLYETEASGGVTLNNVKKIASAGVKRISIGQITHSAPAIDFKLEI